MKNPFVSFLIFPVAPLTLMAIILSFMGGCATGPVCTGTQEEVEQCQERMARARENRMMNREFGGRYR